MITFFLLASTPEEQIIISSPCIKSAAAFMRSYVITAFDQGGISECYKVHEEDDCSHEKMGFSLLAGLARNDYGR